MRRKTFISFASLDRKMALTISTALEARGLPCWISCRDVHAGENYQEKIVAAIASAGAMLLVFSSHANNSDEIKKEMALASQHKLAVIPVRLEDVVPSGAFSYELATRQWFDLFTDWEQAMSELAAQLEAVIPGDGSAAAPTPAVPAAPPPSAPKKGPWIPSWTLIVGLAVAGLLVSIAVTPMLGILLWIPMGMTVYRWIKNRPA